MLLRGRERRVMTVLSGDEIGDPGQAVLRRRRCKTDSGAGRDHLEQRSLPAHGLYLMLPGYTTKNASRLGIFTLGKVSLFIVSFGPMILLRLSR